MPDNTGAYISNAKFLNEFAKAKELDFATVSLASRVVTVAPAGTFTYTGDLVPEIGDWITQGDYLTQITAVAGSLITLQDVTNIANGIAKIIKSDLTLAEMNEFIAMSMAFVDRVTRQWFNARTLSYKSTGNNSRLMLLPVPIISISSIKLNDYTTLLATDYIAGNSRTIPDDRRNPHVKLVSNVSDVLSCSDRVFRENRITQIDGTFGFLEPDGSTPLLIQKATNKLAVMYASKTAGESVVSNANGAIKREKTDLHEIEYFNPDSSNKHSTLSGSGLSGDDEVDDILAMYKGPILIGGSFIDSIEVPSTEESW